jgi:hypothetical protein
MSERSEEPAAPMPDNETDPQAVPSTEIKNMPIDWTSVGYGARAVGVISAAAVGITFGLQLYLEGEGSKDNNTQSVASSSLSPSLTEAPKTKKCRDISGVLRVIGVSAKDVKTINDQDDVGKIPHIYHQRDDNGDKVDIDHFQGRVDEQKLGNANDSAFYTAARYHFKPYTERSSEPMLNENDVLIPDNAFNLDGAVGEIVQIGHMKFCETE